MPDEYQVDPFTSRRLTKEVGEPLPDGALHALYKFDQEHPDLAAATIDAFENSAEFTWLRAMMLAKLGRSGYVKELRALAVEAEQDIARQLDTLRRERAHADQMTPAMFQFPEFPRSKPERLLRWLLSKGPASR